MPISFYILLFATVIVSGSSILIFKIKEKIIKLILSFSGAYILAITILYLIPEIYTGTTDEIGIYILTGFFLQIFFDFFSGGIEHGHVHIHKHSGSAFPIMMMLALLIHSFLEGMPLAGEMDETKRSLFVGIILHNIPIAIILMNMFISSDISRQKAFLWLIVFALATPLGTITNVFLGENIFSSVEGFNNKIMGIVIGIFLHISTTILFESEEEHQFNLLKFFSILIGIVIALIQMIF